LACQRSATTGVRHISDISLCYLNNNNNNKQGAAAKQAVDNKTAKYQRLEKTRIFFPVVIKISGSWSQHAIELVQEIMRRTTVITEDSRETTFLFQRLSIHLQGEMQSHS